MNFHEPNTLKVRMHRVNLSRTVTPIKVMVTGDWHISPIVSKRQQEFLQDAISQAEPNLIILQGDLVDSPAELKRDTSLTKLRASLSLCAKNAPTVLVLGSHDYISTTDPAIIMKDFAIPFWKKLCKETGVKLLIDDWYEQDGIRVFGAFQTEKCMITEDGGFRDNPMQFLRQLQHYDFSRADDKTKINWFAAHAPYITKPGAKLLECFDVTSYGHTHGGVVPKVLDEVFTKLHIHRGLISPNRHPLPRNSRGMFKIGKDTVAIVNPGMVGAQFCAPKVAQRLNFVKAAEVSVVDITGNPQ